MVVWKLFQLFSRSLRIELYEGNIIICVLNREGNALFKFKTWVVVWKLSSVWYCFKLFCSQAKNIRFETLWRQNYSLTCTRIFYSWGRCRCSSLIKKCLMKIVSILTWWVLDTTAFTKLFAQTCFRLCETFFVGCPV